MSSDDPNPFVEKHRDHAAKAWRLEDSESYSSVGEERLVEVKDETKVNFEGKK